MEKVVNNTIHSAKIILYKKHRGRTLFLLLKEPEKLYSFIGGAQDTNDHAIIDTARRELFEEVGLTEKSCKLKETTITHEFVHSDPQSNRFGKKGKLHAFLAHYNGNEKINLEAELLGYEWITAEEVLKKLASSYDYLPTVFEKVKQEIDSSK